VSTMGNVQFQMVEERGWRRGLGNLLRGEFSSWFHSIRWLKHLVIWLLVINGMIAIMAYATADAARSGGGGPPLLLMYGLFGGMFVAFGVMVIMQRVIVGEKRYGTAAWVLSKPVTRSAFVVSRLVVNSLAILLTTTVVPGLLVYVTFGGFTPLGWLSPPTFLAGILLFALHNFFWITLVLMMGTLFDSAATVIAVPIAFYFFLWLGPGLVPALNYISPMSLAYISDERVNPLAASLMLGQPVFSWLPLIATVVYCVIFVTVAIWRFNRQEF
jgi:ABC-2 type transport system permease protein